ncbi:DUF2950 domain-containing protein [Edaphobacter aggregans]|uniref:DUF2950 domain-containing protein n=1 Tax=Edaphobacter aggregans TaxID=570835 RepID=UPI000558D331|nr:DUF2950 domain-containing protein [Edaphobacter aggregans]
MRLRKHIIPLAMLGLTMLLVTACKRRPSQAKFATPDEAAAALQQALKTEDMGKWREIFGRDAIEAVESGDPVSDRNDRQVVALAMEESWHWSPRGADSKELIIGDEQWPFPVPLLKSGDKWQFDSQAGRQEVLARRIGGNELGVINVCRAYVDAQREYASQSHDGIPVGIFAQHVRSSPGRQDGLYWERKHGEKRSPLGDLVAQAAEEGYDPNKSASDPLWGYHFRILTAQGPAAPGGKKSYVKNGVMKGGFALLAYPAKYAYSGVMTFVVGQDGVVYQKDLGDDTATEALSLAEYNPDASWAAVQPE